ncbi:CDP-ribitol ribitolphosphotransferase [Lachnospiraceae bacterium]|nr:CDP-ribitol ribitolphosphotransferase [Lachnospiraceae bacterium]
MAYIVNNIKWDRIWISFYIDNISPDSNEGYPTFYIKDLSSEYYAKLRHSEDNPSEYKLNITNPGNCRMLPAGVYSVLSSENEPVTYSNTINVKRYNRQFIYFHSERAYRVQFSARNGLRIKTSDTKLKNLGLKKCIISGLRRSRHNLAKAILRLIYNIFYLMYHRKDSSDIHSIKNPRILLMSDQSEAISPNMAALKVRLTEEGYAPEEALRAVTTKHYSLLHWIKTLKKIAEADYIFLDDHSQTTDWLTIKNTIITQLWHAGAGFKSTGYSRFGMPASPAPWSGHRQYTYGIAGSKKIRHFFSEVWGINDSQVLPTGMPRLDEYLDDDHKRNAMERILLHNPILCKQSRIILFAPTYRGENKKHAYYPYDMLDFDKLYKLCQDTDSVIIFKMHPFISEPVPIPEEYKDRLTDMSDYPNINDLFYITDLLITDYSSNIYEFSLMKKPMLFFAYDIKDYMKERGFHRDYRTNVPGKIVESFDDMVNAIYSEDFEYDKVAEYIENNFDYVDTHACDRIIEWIIRGNLPY